MRDLKAALLAFALLGTGPLLTACDDNDGTAERAGEAVDDATKDAGKALDNATDKAGDAARDAGDAIKDATKN